MNVAPGVSSSFINGLPADTLIQFANGTYQGLSLLPKTGQIFRGNPANPAAVVLQGTGNFRAFHGGSGNAPDVTISGLTITGYQSGMGSQFVSQPTGAGRGRQGADRRDRGRRPGLGDRRLPAGRQLLHGAPHGQRHPGQPLHDQRQRPRRHPGRPRDQREPRARHGDRGHDDRGQLPLQHEQDLGQRRHQVRRRRHAGRPRPRALPARNNIVRRCIITANNGPGIWWDWDVFDGEIHHCSIFANHASGIVIEASATAHIHHNQIGDNCTGSLPALISFRCCALGVQNSKKCVIEHNLFVITRENSMAITQHNRATGTVNTPKGGVYVGWFTGTENRWQGNVYLLLANGPFVEQFHTHSCGNPNVACSGTSCSFMCGTSQTGCNITSTPTGPTLGGNYLCFIPQAGDDHHNVSQGNTYRIATGSPAQWPFEEGATVLGNPASLRPRLAAAPDLDHAAGQDVSRACRAAQPWAKISPGSIAPCDPARGNGRATLILRAEDGSSAAGFTAP